ncbi:hypothetical protein ACFXJO_03520 [Streptomyces lavendulae]|uniref:hypothetical protein n=1 Tax=Streptomyces lavendulae TaxID=1914 RepID=UPI003699E298
MPASTQPPTTSSIRTAIRTGAHYRATDVRAVTAKDSGEIIGFTFEDGGLFGATDTHGTVLVSCYLKRGTATAYLHRNAPAPGQARGPATAAVADAPGEDIPQHGAQAAAVQRSANGDASRPGTDAHSSEQVVRDALAVLHHEQTPAAATVTALPEETGWHVRPDGIGRPGQVIVRWVHRGSFRPVSLHERDAHRAQAHDLFTRAGWTPGSRAATFQIFRAPTATPTTAPALALVADEPAPGSPYAHQQPARDQAIAAITRAAADKPAHRQYIDLLLSHYTSGGTARDEPTGDHIEGLSWPIECALSADFAVIFQKLTAPGDLPAHFERNYQRARNLAKSRAPRRREPHPLTTALQV